MARPKHDSAAEDNPSRHLPINNELVRTWVSNLALIYIFGLDFKKAKSLLLP